jgi:hypothetical protein
LSLQSCKYAEGENTYSCKSVPYRPIEKDFIRVLLRVALNGLMGGDSRLKGLCLERERRTLKLIKRGRDS